MTENDIIGMANIFGGIEEEKDKQEPVKSEKMKEKINHSSELNQNSALQYTIKTSIQSDTELGKGKIPYGKRLPTFADLNKFKMMNASKNNSEIKDNEIKLNQINLKRPQRIIESAKMGEIKKSKQEIEYNNYSLNELNPPKITRIRQKIEEESKSYGHEQMLKKRAELNRRKFNIPNITAQSETPVKMKKQNAFDERFMRSSMAQHINQEYQIQQNNSNQQQFDYPQNQYSNANMHSYGETMKFQNRNEIHPSPQHYYNSQTTQNPHMLHIPQGNNYMNQEMEFNPYSQQSAHNEYRNPYLPFNQYELQRMNYQNTDPYMQMRQNEQFFENKINNFENRMTTGLEHNQHIQNIHNEPQDLTQIIKERGYEFLEKLQGINDSAKKAVINEMLDGEWHKEKDLIRIVKQTRYIGRVSFGIMMLSIQELINNNFIMKDVKGSHNEAVYKIEDNFVGLARAAFMD